MTKYFPRTPKLSKGKKTNKQNLVGGDSYREVTHLLIIPKFASVHHSGSPISSNITLKFALLKAFIH